MIKTFFLTLFLFIGIIFLCTSILTKAHFAKKKKNCTQIVEASIMDINKIVRTESGISTPQYVSYFPVYEYEYNGITYKRSMNVGNLKNAFELGKKVKIYIDPQNPEEIYEDSKVPKLVVFIFGLLGILFIIISLFILILFQVFWWESLITYL